MASLFNISSELKSIIEEIEYNGGEVTDEILEQLAITEDNLKDKLSNYRKYITASQGEISILKEEIARLQGLVKSKDKTINRLKSNMLQAVNDFGEEGKSGNKVIDLIDCKLYTRNSNVIAVNEEKANLLVELVFDVFKDMYDCGMIAYGNNAYDTNTQIIAQEFIDRVNEHGHTSGKLEDDYNYSVDDLHIIKMKFTTECFLNELITDSKTSIIGNYFEQEETSNISIEVPKIIAKSYIENSNITIANKEISQSLQIR